MNPLQTWKIGDCLELLPEIPDKSIDMILTDLPYGTTACKWDTIIPIEPLWVQYKRIIKDDGAIVLTASQPFTSKLITSNIEMFKYQWIWEKTKAGNFINANNAPMKLHEDVCIFSKGTCANHSPRRMKYFPQGVKDVNIPWSRPAKYETELNYKRPSHKLNRIITKTGFPGSVLKFKSVPSKEKIHSTQKPLALFEYLIRTYTNEGDTVHDSCLGSGTTLEACANLNRNCIGFELNYCWEDSYRKRLKYIADGCAGTPEPGVSCSPK